MHTNTHTHTPHTDTHTHTHHNQHTHTTTNTHTHTHTHTSTLLRGPSSDCPWRPPGQEHSDPSPGAPTCPSLGMAVHNKDTEEEGGATRNERDHPALLVGSGDWCHFLALLRSICFCFCTLSPSRNLLENLLNISVTLDRCVKR